MPVKEAKKEAKEVLLRVPASCRPATCDRERQEEKETVEEYTEGIYRLTGRTRSGGYGRYCQIYECRARFRDHDAEKAVGIGTGRAYALQGCAPDATGRTRFPLVCCASTGLWSGLLVDFLELPWEDVHELACKLEHFLSEPVTDRIAHAMNYPTTCPHGNPIDATFQRWFAAIGGL